MAVFVVPTVRVSDETWKRLKAWAEPPEDTADDALRKVLDLADRYRDDFGLNRDTRSSSQDDAAAVKHNEVEKETPTDESRQFEGRLERGRKTPEAEFYRPILDALAGAGGHAAAGHVLDSLGGILKDRLNAVDYQPISTGDPRWRNTAGWACKQLREAGYLYPADGSGVWRLTEKGRIAVERKQYPTRLK